MRLWDGVLVCYLSFLAIALPAWAGSEKSTGADFLRIEPGARAAAMGGGFSALTEDADAMYYNPAGLAMVGRTRITATHIEWLAGLQNEFAAAAFPMGAVGLGFALSYLHAEETERDDVGRPLSTFVVGDGSLSVGAGLRLTDRHHLGFTGKFLTRTLYHRSATGYAVDLGYQYRLETRDGHLWKIGGVIRNIGPKIGFSVKEKLPTELEAAAAYQPELGLRRPLTFNLAIRQSQFQKGVGISTGAEYTLFSRFHLRAGYAYAAEGSEKLRAGFGVDLFELGKIDFAAVRIGQFNSSLFLSLTLQLDRK